MKNTIYFLSILSLLLLNSCTKVININLNKTDPKLVIEGVVNADSTTHYVMLTNSINFDQDIAPPIVTGATITLKEVNTNTIGNYVYNDQLGKYVLSNFLVKEGNTYELSVISNGKTYLATSTVPSRVKLDSLKFVTYPFGPTLSYTLVPMLLDPAGIANFYKFNITRDGKLISGIYVEDDLGLDGQLTKRPIFPNNNDLAPDTVIGDIKKWKKKVGNTIEIHDSIYVELEMLCIENKVYRYFLTLALNQGNQQSATPSNPDPLFSNGALGYFSAQTSQRKSIYITNK